MNYNKMLKVDIIKRLNEAEKKNQELETKNEEIKTKCETYSNKYYEITKKYNTLVRDKDYKNLYKKEQDRKEKVIKDYNSLVKRFETSIQNRNKLLNYCIDMECKSLDYIEFLRNQFNKIEKLHTPNNTKTIEDYEKKSKTFSKEFDEIQNLVLLLNYEFSNL